MANFACNSSRTRAAMSCMMDKTSALIGFVVGR